VLRRLRRVYPDARCELDFSGPLELAVAAILSAQCTDRRVNQVTPALFAKYRTARDWAAVPQETLEAEIRPTGFFRNKARNIRALMAELDAKHGGRLPGDFDALCGLPGIGRKTANLLVATVFGRPGLVVDTHCGRLSRRLGFSRHEDPAKIEFDLRALVPERDWTDWSHAMVFHGRRCCHARGPECRRCPLADLCPSFCEGRAHPPEGGGRRGRRA
jgi:endonuclease-3